MARWKLCRQTYGKEEFTILEGEEITIGRGVNNTIVLSSIVISRNHCVINVQRNKLIITDLKSSNGIYVGLKKIPPNTPCTITEADLIGIGWTTGAPVSDINDNEKYMFRLVRELPSPPSVQRIQFQSDNELDELENEIAAIDGPNVSLNNGRSHSPVIPTKNSVKRKLDELETEVKVQNVVVKIEPEVQNHIVTSNDDVISLLSDSDNDIQQNQQINIKKPKLDSIREEISNIGMKGEQIKTEQDEYDVFNVKQEYLGYNEDPICVESESDDDDESVQWLMRLSQSSPGKPFTKVRESKAEVLNDENSYSQIEGFEDDEFLHDLISIPDPPLEDEEVLDQPHEEQEEVDVTNKAQNSEKQVDDEDEVFDDIISLHPTINDKPIESTRDIHTEGIDVVDGTSTNHVTIDSNDVGIQLDKAKKAQLIEPQILATRNKTVQFFNTINESKSKKTSSRSRKESKHSSKIQITNSQKEERKRKLKEIATKGKEDLSTDKISTKESKDKGVASVKLTNTSRGAFLAEVVQVVKPMKRKESPQHSSTTKEQSPETSPKTSLPSGDPEPSEDIENKRRSEKIRIQHKPKDKHESSKAKAKAKHSRRQSHSSESRVPLKSLKPLSESEEKPFSKVDPMPPKKPKKSVRFSMEPPRVRVFVIEDGNTMKSTKLVKASADNYRPKPFFSLEKVTLMKILRWNPHWLEEQLSNNDPPPILGHNNPPMTIFHSFSTHQQYVQLVGDLLLMEIWECLTQGYMRVRNKNIGIKMVIGSLPPIPTHDRLYDLFNISVDLSVPTSEVRTVPRIGEILLMSFGPENVNRRFFFVHNVRCLPSPKNNIHSFFSLSLHACYTDKMRTLKPGDTMIGVSLAYIQNELQLYEAMDCLKGSPLSEAILRPEPRHFVKTDPHSSLILNEWTKTLNPSQQAAVSSSVSAALSEKPCIQMVQGPPGTGKSSVICSIVVSYFYDTQGRKQQNRGKVLICATSNAAVDELVCRLLNIRQSLPKSERFRMVRVGRAEAMHPQAFNISSQQLAQRDAAARQQVESAHLGLSEEISHVEAKINMWRTQEQDAKDPERAAYCRQRINNLHSRLALLRSNGGVGGGGEQLRADQLAQAERRIVEGADIVVTTLASAHNYKMKGLKRRIALCIVDEAGQAIEPETLIPLTLDVTHLTLIGDPQQLPGYICSQRAKKHGLGESLFSRLTSCAEHWVEGNPVILLNRQYRMHAEIAEYPNRAFYGGLVQSYAPPRPDLPLPPYCILSISSGDKGQGASGANEMEAWGVARIVTALNGVLRPRGLSLAVITPYNAHKDLIKRNLKMLQDGTDNSGPIEVNTVDSFQGQERDVVVVSLARSHGVGFLTDAGRMNVMLTRAKHALLVCLNPNATLKNEQWRTLIEDAQRRNLFRILPNKMCQGSPGQNQKDDILKYVTYTKSSK